MSPDVYTLHPFLLLFQSATPPCGLGGSTTQSGPCTGSYGPSVSSGATSVLSSGVGGVALIGVAVLALLALLVLCAFAKRAISAKAKVRRKRKGDLSEPSGSEGDAATCVSCGDTVDASEGSDALCPDCRISQILDGLEPGQGFCYGCAVVYDSDCGCPFCGSAGVLGDESDAAPVAECAICGEPIGEGDGGDSMFGPVHAECVAASEAEARTSEIDADGPDGDNPDGIGSGDSGWRE